MATIKFRIFKNRIFQQKWRHSTSFIPSVLFRIHEQYCLCSASAAEMRQKNQAVLKRKIQRAPKLAPHSPIQKCWPKRETGKFIFYFYGNKYMQK
jgi:hypothetical protein